MARVSPTELFPLPPGVWIAIGLAIVVSVVMRQTVFGRYIYAIGSNEATARLCGIRVRLQKVLIYALAGLLFGLAGLMQVSRLTQGDPTVAIGLELDIIAAVVIGGASLSGGTGSILGSMIGALIMAVLRNGSNQMGWQNFTQEIIIGIVIIIAVGLDSRDHGGAFHLVDGAAVRRRPRVGVQFFHHRAISHRRARRLVLPGQTFLAGGFDFFLPALEDQPDHRWQYLFPAAAAAAARRAVGSEALGARASGGAAFLYRNALPGAGLF
jgi:hypothetical protein